MAPLTTTFHVFFKLNSGKYHAPPGRQLSPEGVDCGELISSMFARGKGFGMHLVVILQRHCDARYRTTEIHSRTFLRQSQRLRRQAAVG